MTPNFSCFGLSPRLVVALALEHVIFLVMYLILQNVEGTNESLRISFHKKKELIRRAIYSQEAPRFPPQHIDSSELV